MPQKVIMIQPASYTDQIRDGHQMTKQPYPLFVEQDGAVRRQDFWKGDPLQVIGFAKDLAVQQIDLWWQDAAADPQRAVGMYLVTADSTGQFSTHPTAVDSVKVLAEADG